MKAGAASPLFAALRTVVSVHAGVPSTTARAISVNRNVGPGLAVLAW
jgi:hypothetical protein